MAEHLAQGLDRQCMYDVMPSAERQLGARLVAWLEAEQTRKELVLLDTGKRSTFRYMVAYYNNRQDSFTDRKSFKTKAEAWSQFTATAEVWCIKLGQ